MGEEGGGRKKLARLMTKFLEYKKKKIKLNKIKLN